MRNRRSKWWWVAAAIGVMALARRGCRSSDERIETFLHVELAPGVTHEAQEKWTPPLDDDATLLDSAPLFDRPAAALAEDQASATLVSGEPMPDLRAWRRVHVRGTRAAID